MALKLPALKVTPADNVTPLLTIKFITLVLALPSETINEPAPVLLNVKSPLSS